MFCVYMSTCFIALWGRKKWGNPPVNAAELRHILTIHETFDEVLYHTYIGRPDRAILSRMYVSTLHTYSTYIS